MKIEINIKETKKNDQQYNRLINKMISLLVNGKGHIDITNAREVKFNVEILAL